MPTEDQALDYHLNSRPGNVNSTRPAAGHFAIRLQHSQTGKVKRTYGRTC